MRILSKRVGVLNYLEKEVLVVKNLKVILVGSLGVVGYVIWYVLLAAVWLLPLIVLDFPFWADVLIILVAFNIPILGSLFEFALWIWSFTIVTSMPIGGFSIFYYIVFGIYILTSVLPFIVVLIATLFDKNYR